MASAGMMTTMTMLSSMGGHPVLLRRGGAGGIGGGGGAAAALSAPACARWPVRVATPTTRRSNSSVADHVIGAAVTAGAAPAPAAAVAGRPSFPCQQPHQPHQQQQQQQQQQRPRQRRRRRPDVSTAAKKRPDDDEPGDDGKGGTPPSRGPGGPSGARGDGQPGRPTPRGGTGSSERADKSKADFSAYWALRFREMFSKRRKYLDSADKPAPGPMDLPDISEKLFDIEELAGERLLEAEAELAELRAGGQAGLERREAAKMAVIEQDAELERRAQERSARGVLGWLSKLKRSRRQSERQGGADAGAGGDGGDGGGADTQGAAGPTRRQAGEFVSPADAERMQARAALSYVASPRVRVLHNAMGAATRVARAVASAPVSLPVALWRRWRAIFQGQSYAYFLDQEAMRMWYWRNRVENERWFWEIYFWDRMLIPTLWTLVYVAAAPANLLWCALIPLLMLAWRDGRMHGPKDWEWWLLMVFGVFGKCRGQIADLVRTSLSWGF